MRLILVSILLILCSCSTWKRLHKKEYTIIHRDTTIIDTTIITIERSLTDTIRISEIQLDTVFQDRVRLIYEKIEPDVVRVQATCIPDTIKITKWKTEIRESKKEVKEIPVKFIPIWMWILIGVASPGLIPLFLYLFKLIKKMFIGL